MNFVNLLKYWLGIRPKWSKCRHASCWDGANAKERRMNMLSPKMPEGVFRSYLKAMKARGCDTAHLILTNKADGEYAGYSPWGNCAPFASGKADAARLMKKRIVQLRKKGFGIVLWLVTDDSKDWAKTIFAQPDAFCRALADNGLLREASTVVLGLEMDEYGSRADWKKLREALNNVYRGRVGVHHTSGRCPFADLGDIIFDQLDPAKASVLTVANSVRKLKATGKAVVGFEYARSPNRVLAQAALDAGAIGCGNW